MVATCDAFGWTRSCKNIQVLSFHWILPANAKNKWFRLSGIQNIHLAVPLPKDENFFVCSNHLGINCLNETLILYLFPGSGHPSWIFKPLDRQNFLPALFCGKTIFAMQLFLFQLSHFLCFKASINYLSYWS